MNDLASRAKQFATQAHQRIDHRRKYTHQPYEVHLKAVSEIVASATADETLIAAAWLHDVVEDTAATHQDIEVAFGEEMARLVLELTDVSKPSDGNRARRKAIDRDHLARASDHAKTIKLADLIDNCRDICRHDARFARAYLPEMAALLEVLRGGDERLYRRAQRELRRGAEQLGLTIPPGSLLLYDEEAPVVEPYAQRRVQRMFAEAFTAEDIAEPLRSFDAKQSSEEVSKALISAGVNVAGVSDAGLVIGYVRLDDLSQGICADQARAFSRDQLVAGDSSLSEVILVLTRHDHCFVSLLNNVAGVIGRADIEKPIVRMWLFGMITMIEMNIVNRIRALWPDQAWRSRLPHSRLAKAENLLEERRRRNQHCDLLDCLQLSDKAQLLLEHPEQLEDFGFQSKSQAKQAVKDLESLRNNLAHSQSIATYDWPQIVRMTQRVEQIVAESGPASSG